MVKMKPMEHCSMCLADKDVFCPRDVDAECLECGQRFCGAHIGEHLKAIHCISLTLDHCKKSNNKEREEVIKMATAMEEKPKKTTPSQCRFNKCKYNSIPPGEGSQECVACEGLKKRGYEPDRSEVISRLRELLAEAELKANKALAGYKFERFGYWAGIWVHVNRECKFHRANPWKDLVMLTRGKLVERGDKR